MKLVVLGLSLSSAWGNGHATTWRALLSGFAARGHDLVLMGSHGHGALVGMLLGSTVSKVLAASKKPVLVVR